MDAQNRQLQYKKPTFSGLKGQQKRSGVAGASAGPCFLKWRVPKTVDLQYKKTHIFYASGQSQRSLGGCQKVWEAPQGVSGGSQGGPSKVSGVQDK